ncbi:MAG: hypothetical protein IT289_08490 [Oligoflexia bacterium]|nr:hypothetical protein [Oligoflexia bacterium]
MKSQGLIKESEEVDLPELGISTKWSATALVHKGKIDLLVMKLVTTLKDGKTEESSEFEVLAVTKENRKHKIKSFESVIQIPQKIIAKVGGLPDGPGNVSYYYVELSGESVIAALKSVMTGTPYAGFLGIVVPGPKAKYDPTPNRTWRIVDATFDLRRGSTGEGLDIQAYQLDEDFHGYFSGAVPTKSSTGLDGVQVGPWFQAFVIEFKKSAE